MRQRLNLRRLSRREGIEQMRAVTFGVRRQSVAATALWICFLGASSIIQSGVALRLATALQIRRVLNALLIVSLLTSSSALGQKKYERPPVKTPDTFR